MGRKWSHRAKAGLKKMAVGMVEGYEDDYTSVEEHEIKLEADNKTLQQQLRSLGRENEIQAREIQDLQAHLKAEAENSEKVKESAKKMAYAMQSKDLYVGRQDSDDAVYTRYQNLISQIKTWSVPFAQDRPPSHFELTAKMIEELQKVAPAVTDFPRFLQNSKNMRLLVRGYVSMAIAGMLFRTFPSAGHPGSGGEDTWMDKELAHGVFLIENSLFSAGMFPSRGISPVLTLLHPRPEISVPTRIA